jgi:hypothetical protein
MSFLRAVWEFVVGDDWLTAAGVVIALGPVCARWWTRAWIWWTIY